MAAFLAPLLLLTAGAEASPLCDRLFARLADLPEAVANDAAPRDFSGAISRQNIELRRARSEQRALGCSVGSVTVVNGDNEEACADLDNRIGEITDALAELKARRIEDIAGSQDDAARRRVLVALQTNRCEEIDSDFVSASVSAPHDGLVNGHRNIIADLPPIGTEDMRGPSSSSPLSELSAPDLHLLTQDGPLRTMCVRTMCVRTCDGAFFPISANAAPGEFDRDAEACSARCPGAQTELYYHPLTGEAADMVSARTGSPYKDLPTAFAYKSGTPATRSQCGCRLPPASAKLDAPAGSLPKMSTRPDKAVVIITTRPGATNPGTSTPGTTNPDAAKAYLPSTAPVTAPAEPVNERPYDPKVNRARQVGPSFLPAEESAIDLQHPAGPGYQQQQTN